MPLRALKGDNTPSTYLSYLIPANLAFILTHQTFNLSHYNLCIALL